jgi:hypothetical protein
MHYLLVDFITYKSWMQDFCQTSQVKSAQALSLKKSHHVTIHCPPPLFSCCEGNGPLGACSHYEQTLSCTQAASNHGSYKAIPELRLGGPLHRYRFKRIPKYQLRARLVAALITFGPVDLFCTNNSVNY